MFIMFLEKVLIRKWKYLRDGMMKCLKKIEVENRSGSAAHRTPTCKHFDMLLFLKDSMSNRSTETNISQLDISVDSDSGTTELHIDSQQLSLTPPSAVAPKRSSAALKREYFEETRERRDHMEILLLESIKASTPASCQSEEGTDDPDVLVCKSLVLSLKKMKPKQNMKAKIEMQQVLLKYEFEDESAN